MAYTPKRQPRRYVSSHQRHSRSSSNPGDRINQAVDTFTAIVRHVKKTYFFTGSEDPGMLELMVWLLFFLALILGIGTKR